MKKLIIALIFTAGASFAGAQELLQQAPSLSGSNAEITFEKEMHDFGKLKQNQAAFYEFTFVNTGTEPLIITNAEGSCDCTVPAWPKHPIRPGEKASIKVEYDTKKSGTFLKTVKITSNARNGKVKEITIQGTVTSPASSSK